MATTTPDGRPTETLPRWDLSGVYPSPDSREYAATLEELAAEAERVTALYDRHGVGRIEPRPPSADDLAAFDEVLAASNRLAELLERPNAYAYTRVTVDSHDAAAQGALSRVEQVSAVYRRLSARLTAWVAGFGPAALVAGSEQAREHAYPLDRLAERARHQMGPEAEDLYAELALTGSGAWARLWGDTTSQLQATVAFPDGRVERLPMAAVRALASDPDPDVRRAAYVAELEAWPSVAVPCAAAMNAVKGEANVVNGRRGWSEPIDAALHANGVEPAVYTAMQSAVTRSLPDFRRFLRAKARLHGHDGGLPWWDLFAPLPGGRAVAWEDGLTAVRDAFASYSPSLAGLLARADRDGWLDAEPREGKQGGAYCISFGNGESRVFLNWSGSPDGVSTLAHEMGHAYHNLQMAGRAPLQRQLTMSMAETASIFCETLMTEAGLAGADDDQRLVLLDIDLRNAAQVVVDIRSRVLFETEVFRRRRRSTVSADDLCAAMVAAQDEAYGDGLADGSRHPWMWAVKPHYYGAHFYNWPYTFGLLFGLGLFAVYRAEPDRFRAGYDDLLSMVGLARPQDLAARFGIDLEDESFWDAGLGTLRARIDDYERLVSGRV